MPNFRPWFEANLGVDLTHKTPSIDADSIKCAESTLNDAFVSALLVHDIAFSNAAPYRIHRSHGKYKVHLGNVP